MMVGWIKKMKKNIDGWWMERNKKKQMDGWNGYKKYMKKMMDGWMDKKI